MTAPVFMQRPGRIARAAADAPVVMPPGMGGA
jgi:hypothetical protein